MTLSPTEVTKNDPSPLRLLANASHEIRGPLHAILGLAELLTKREIRQEDKRLVHALQTEASALRVLIDDLLDYSRAAESGLELESDSFGIAELVANVVESSRPLAENKGLELILLCDPEVPQFVLGDKVRYGQVVRNLIRNAVKFTETGSVTVELNMHDGLLACSVVDTGPGILPNMIGSIFTPFVQAHSTATGSGLGLAISSELARLMGGYIGVESEPEQGSKFTFVAALPSAKDSGKTVADANLSANVGRILVVEDNEVNQLLARKQLEILGYEPVVVGTGEEAVERAGENFAAILMDWNLPGIDGLEATRQIRADESIQPHPAIIAMTANALSSDEDECIAAGMSKFLSKPVSIEDLEQALQSVIPQAQTREVDRRKSAAMIEDLVETLGGVEIVLQLVETFVSELSKHSQMIAAMVMPTDSQQLARSAHTLSSSAALLGASELTAIAQLLNRSDVKFMASDQEALLTQVDGAVKEYSAAATRLRSQL